MHCSYLLVQKGDRMTVEEVQKIIDEVDENRDGKLNYREVFSCNAFTVNQRKLFNTIFSNNNIGQLWGSLDNSSVIIFRKDLYINVWSVNTPTLPML